MDLNIVKEQLVYFASVPAAGTSITAQWGPALLTIDTAHATAGKYTLTLPATWTVPKDRRFVSLTANSATATGFSAQYDHAGSADNTVIVFTATGAGAAGDCAFFVKVYRLALLP